MRVVWDGLIGPTLKEALLSFPKGPPKPLQGASKNLKKSVFDHPLPTNSQQPTLEQTHSAIRTESTQKASQNVSNGILNNLKTLLAPLRAVATPVPPKPVALRSARAIHTQPTPLLRSARPNFKSTTFVGRYPSTNLGLNAARNFSSGAGPVESIAKNVPIWIRALADEFQEGGKGLKGANGGVKAQKMCMRDLLKRELRRERIRKEKTERLEPKELGTFFSVPSLPATSASNQVQEAGPSSYTILTVPLEPVLPSSLTSPPASNNSRLIPSSLGPSLSHLQSLYSLHSTRLSNLESKLRMSGAWEDIKRVQWDFEPGDRWEGRKIVRYVWELRDGVEGWGLGRLEQALGMWKGEERWFGLEEVRNELAEGEGELGESCSALESSVLTLTSVSTPTSLRSISFLPTPSLHSLSQSHSEILSSSSASHFLTLSSSMSQASEDFIIAHSLRSPGSPSNQSTLSFSASFLDNASTVGSDNVMSLNDQHVASVSEDERHMRGVDGFLRSLEELGDRRTNSGSAY